MHKLTCLLFVNGLVISACSSHSDSSSATSESLSSALTKHVKFDNGTVVRGNLPKSNADGERASIAPDQAVLTMAPALASLMSIDVQNPDQDKNPVRATLMQFIGSDSRIEVLAGSMTTLADAGSDQSAIVHMENPFKVDADICTYLCKGKLTAQLEITVKLENGGVCKHQTREVELDCSDDGDPKQCKAGNSGGGNPKSDAGMRDAGAGSKNGTGGKSGSHGTGGKSAGSGGANASGGSGGTGVNDEDAGPAAPAPQIGPILPASATAGDALTLTITGSGFRTGATAYVDGLALATNFDSATSLSANVPASATHDPGNLAIYVENTRDDDRTRSNVLYLRVDPAIGAPVIYDYSPDNGVAGDKIVIIASNLSTQTLTITDAKGNQLTPGTLGTISWPNASAAETVEITLPDNIATGPLTVANSLGSFKGKIFTVGRNLTRADGTVLTFSTEYNTTNWSHVSGGDNLLSTSFFTAHGDCASTASCTTKPFFTITFASAQTVARIAMRGNREYASGYDFISGKFEIFDGGGNLLWEGTYDLPEPDRDLDIVLPAPVDHALSVKFSGLSDESDEPGFSELEVFGP